MNPNLIELGKTFKSYKDAHEKAKAQLDEINAQWEECEKELLAAMLEDCVNSIDIDGVGKISLVRKSFLSVNAANKPAFYSYLKASGNGSLLKEDVNPRTLGAFLKEHVAELAAQYKAQGMDEVDAKVKAEEFLKEKGASHFSENSLSLRKS